MPPENWIGEREYIERLLSEMDRRFEQRFADHLQAVDKAERATEERFRAINAFRQTLTDQAGTFMPRTEADARFANLRDRLDGLLANLAAMMPRQEIETLINSNIERSRVGYQANADALDQLEARFDRREGELAGLPPAVAERFDHMSVKIDTIGDRIQKSEGQASGLHQGWGYLVGAVGLTAAVVSLVMQLLRGVAH